MVCIVYEWVMSRVRMSHVTYTHESCAVMNATQRTRLKNAWQWCVFYMNEALHMYEWVMAYPNESCHISKWAMSHIWMSTNTPQRTRLKNTWQWCVFYMDEALQVYEWVMSLTRMHRVTYTNESRAVYECTDMYEWVMLMSHVRMSHADESCTNESCWWVMY